MFFLMYGIAATVQQLGYIYTINNQNLMCKIILKQACFSPSKILSSCKGRVGLWVTADEGPSFKYKESVLILVGCRVECVTDQ